MVVGERHLLDQLVVGEGDLLVVGEDDLVVIRESHLLEQLVVEEVDWSADLVEPCGLLHFHDLPFYF